MVVVQVVVVWKMWKGFSKRERRKIRLIDPNRMPLLFGKFLILFLFQTRLLLLLQYPDSRACAY
jgi:hypothetical protein